MEMGGTRFDQPPAPREPAAMPRFILLEHVGAPDDPTGRHFDLLLEAGTSCATWRLAEIPAPGGPAVTAVEIAPHRLAWLDHVAGEVSGGRGFARRIDGGTYEPAIEPSAEGTPRERIHVRLVGDTSTRSLLLDPEKGASHQIGG